MDGTAANIKNAASSDPTRPLRLKERWDTASDDIRKDALSVVQFQNIVVKFLQAHHLTKQDPYIKLSLLLERQVNIMEPITCIIMGFGLVFSMIFIQFL